MTDIESRLANLERQVKRWRAATAALVACGVVAVAVGAQREPRKPAALTVTSLTIVNADGDTLATLGPDKASGRGAGGGALVLHNAAGEPLVVARAQADAATLSVGSQDLGDAGGNASVGWKKAGGGSVTVRAVKGKGEASMLIDGDGEAGGALAATDDNGKLTWRSGPAGRKLIPFNPGQ